MSVSAHTRSIRERAREDAGFTMILALGVMLVTSLLLLAAFTAANGDIELSRADLNQKQAYNAALAGVQEYESELQSTPNYWQSCPTPSGTVPGEAHESYAVTPLPANSASACSSSKPFETMIESSGVNANTFRIKSVGTVGKSKRTLIATFNVSGFLDYVYFTQFEDEDPYLTGRSQAECERYYYEPSRTSNVTRSSGCQNIEFAKEDSVNGPMHTDDSALVECNNALTFGRETQTYDAIEVNGGTWSSSSTTPSTTPCSSGSTPTFYTESKTYAKGSELLPPKSDTSLKSYVEPGYEFTGLTKLKLEGEKVTVTNANFHSGAATQISLPTNGLIFVKSTSSGCGYEYTTTNSDTSTTNAKETECGTADVQGTYSKSLTIGAEADVVITGNIVPTGVTAGKPPTGTTVLGLMATRFVRVYHPCVSNTNQTGKLTNPWIYAAILSTAHSFIVDNFGCGAPLENLNVYGAIGQKFRGPVGEGPSSCSFGTCTGENGYKKEYIYDERLATDEPPYFLAPLDAGWRIARQTAPAGG